MKYIAKTILSLLLLFTIKMDLFGQAEIESIADSASSKKQAENIIRTSNDLKTGNWQDVLSSFLQLSISDLTGTNKALNFKSTLFALKLKADSSLLIDKKYINQKFARNFQFDLSLKLDSNYKFTGFQSGFTWALINKRDSTIFSLVNTLTDSLYLIVQTDLQNAFHNFQLSLSDSAGNIKPQNMELFNKVKTELENNTDANGLTKMNLLPKELQPFLKENYDKNLQKADSLFNEKLEELRGKPLLTLSANSTFKNNEQAFNNGEAQLIYLQGIKSKTTNTELDLRSSISVKDTTVITTTRRTRFKSSAGINFSLIHSKDQKSIFELKPYFEYQNILTNPIADEKKEIFSANADLRLRILNNLWLPLTITYDLKRGKFLGFLNVAFNFDAFKK